VTLRPTDVSGAIVTGRGGAEWYVCSLSPVECDAFVEAMRARVDGRTVKMSKDNGNGGEVKAPEWWKPQIAGDLTAIEVDAPTYWLGVSKGEGKMYLRRSL
jgi:hypothetical protein